MHICLVSSFSSYANATIINKVSGIKYEGYFPDVDKSVMKDVGIAENSSMLSV